MMRIVLLLIISITLAQTTWGHGDLSRRIAAKTKAIAKNPKNPDLYLERGFLYQQHEEWDNALADYLQSKHLGQKDKMLHFRTAEIYLQLSLYKSGLTCTQAYLAIDSLDVKIHKLRGSLYYQSKNYVAALTSFDYVIKNSTDLRPENYLILAKTYFEQDSTQKDQILGSINQGLEQLGQTVFVLQEKKLFYLKRFNQIDKATAQYDIIIANNKRKENWYYQKANYLYWNQKYKAAQSDLTKAETAFNKLKPHKQKTKAMLQLLANIHTLKQKLEKHAD